LNRRSWQISRVRLNERCPRQCRSATNLFAVVDRPDGAPPSSARCIRRPNIAISIIRNGEHCGIRERYRARTNKHIFHSCSIAVLVLSLTQSAPDADAAGNILIVYHRAEACAVGGHGVVTNCARRCVTWHLSGMSCSVLMAAPERQPLLPVPLLFRAGCLRGFSRIAAARKFRHAAMWG